MYANIYGSEKLPLLVGRFYKPKCFKNAGTIPVQYEASKKSMDGKCIVLILAKEIRQKI